MASPLGLYAVGVISAGQAFAGFGDPTVIFIASLFVVSEALDATGVTTRAGQRLVAAAGASTGRLAVYVLLLSAGMSAILTPDGAVAALLPMTVLVAVRLRLAPSKLLVPMAFSAHTGSLLVLTGSPVNVLVSDEANRPGGGAFGFFEFALVGVPLTIGAVAGVRLARRLLPAREPVAMSVDLSGHTRTLMAQYAVDRDVLVRHEVPEELFTRRSGVGEVVIPPRSPLIGTTLFPGMATPSGDLLVLAVQRQGAPVGPTGVALGAGDAVLVEGSWEALDEHLDDEVLVVDAPDAVRRQVVPLNAGARRTLLVVGAMVVALASGAVPAAVAAMAIVVLGVMRTEDADGAISWTTVVLIAGVIPSRRRCRTRARPTTSPRCCSTSSATRGRARCSPASSSSRRCWASR
jgi:di/tricarboxylate transporter